MPTSTRQPRRAVVRHRKPRVVEQTLEAVPAGATPLTPRRRFLRSVVQVVLAVGAAIPTAVQLLGLSAATAAKVTGVAGAVVLIVVAAQNALEAKTGRTLLAPKPPTIAGGPDA